MEGASLLHSEIVERKKKCFTLKIGMMSAFLEV